MNNYLNFSKTFTTFFYGIPTVICLIGYHLRTIANYKKCIALRAKDKYFVSDSIGTVIGRYIISLMPLVNILAAVFDLKVLGNIIKAFDRFISIPLVKPVVKEEK